MSIKITVTLLIVLLLATLTLCAAEPGLVPETPGATPDYFCTWNVQGFACGYAGASPQADQMVEANLFGSGPLQNWLGFFPEVRGDLIFLLDDAYDFPLGGGHHHLARGSVELDAGRFPSLTGTPAERLTKLNTALQAKGWRGLGLWICNSRNRLPGQENIGSDDYWAERLRWSQQAGVLYWKVDWGIGDRGKPLWKFRMLPRIHELAPDIWLEYASLTLVTTNALAGNKVLAQDLAGSTPVDITREVSVDGGRLTLPGSVLHRVGLMAAKPGDISDPGLVLVIEGLTRFAPKKPMQPGSHQPQTIK